MQSFLYIAWNSIYKEYATYVVRCWFHQYLLKESLTFVSCPDPPSSREVKCLVSQASILGPAVSIEALYLVLQIDQCEFHKITLSGMIKVLSLASNKCCYAIICQFIFLELSQKFGLVTPNSFSLCELDGVWAGDYTDLACSQATPRFYLTAFIHSCI